MILSNPLKPCPDKPNCVSTTSQDRRHSMLPLQLKGDVASSVKRLKEIVLSFPRTSLQREDENFLHFTFKSALFGFIDDVEFYLDPQNKVIHFRSSSRTGYSDLGVNRKRMEQITAQF